MKTLDLLDFILLNIEAFPGQQISFINPSDLFNVIWSSYYVTIFFKNSLTYDAIFFFDKKEL